MLKLPICWHPLWWEKLWNQCTYNALCVLNMLLLMKYNMTGMHEIKKDWDRNHLFFRKWKGLLAPQNISRIPSSSLSALKMTCSVRKLYIFELVHWQASELWDVLRCLNLIWLNACSITFLSHQALDSHPWISIWNSSMRALFCQVSERIV